MGQKIQFFNYIPNFLFKRLGVSDHLLHFYIHLHLANHPPQIVKVDFERPLIQNIIHVSWGLLNMKVNIKTQSHSLLKFL